MSKRHSLTTVAAGMILAVGAPAAQADPKDPPVVEEVSFEALHMGSSVQAWQEYRAGERASASDTGGRSSSVAVAVADAPRVNPAV
jgi:hypothetical protein